MSSCIYIIISVFLVILGADCLPSSSEIASSGSHTVIIDNSSPTMKCPDGYEARGNECFSTIVLDADIRCPSGFILVDNRCAKFSSKLVYCHPGSTKRVTSSQTIDCVRTIKAEPDIACPGDYLLDENEQECIKEVKLAEIPSCPPGSSARGDLCIRETAVEPITSCSPEATLTTAADDTKICVYEKIYNCTPPPEAVPIKVNRDKNSGRSNEHTTSYITRKLPEKTAAPERRLLTRRGISGDTSSYTSGSNSKSLILKEYETIISRTCKLIRHEKPYLECPEGILDNSLCIISTPEPKISKTGGYKQERVSAIYICPPDYTNSCDSKVIINKKTNKKCMCTLTTEVPSQFTCPNGSIDVGSKCATYSAFSYSCLQGFTLNDEKKCQRSVQMAPIVEYTIKYQCTGTGCSDRPDFIPY